MKKTIVVNKNTSLHYIEMKKLKTTVVGVYIRRRLSEEEAAYNAVLPYVLKSGCKKYPTIMAINERLEELYGAKLNGGVLKNGDNQVIFFDAETISDRYAPNREPLVSDLISLLMSVLFEPAVRCGAFNSETVKREKKTVKDKIDALINDKRTYAITRCTEEMCKDSAFAISKYGTAEQLDSVGAKDLYAHYKKIITSSQIDIFVAGEADCEKLTEEIKKYTEKLEFTEAVYEKQAAVSFDADTKNVTDKFEVTQGKLVIGYTTGINALSAEYPAMLLADSIYGAGTFSKLFNNVREKLSLAYYAASRLNKYNGIVLVDAGIEFENFKKAYDEICIQLKALKDGEISDDEFNFSKIAAINALDSYYDDQRYMQLYVLDCIYLGIEADIEKFKEKINAVTKEEIKAAAEKIKENTVYFLTGKNE